MFDNNDEIIIENTVIDGGGSHRVFSMDGTQIELIGLTMQNGYNDGWGGSISSDSYSDLTIRNSIIKNSHANNGGGGINSNKSHLTLIDVDLIGNSAGIAGAINAGSNDSTFTANISVTSCLFSSNQATDGTIGGAQLGYGTSVIEVHNSEFIDNHATGYGGLIVRNDFIIDSCLFVDNTASFYGAGGGISGGTGILSNSVFVNNSIDSLDVNVSSGGGGLSLWSDTNVEVLNCTFSGNIANTGGGLSVGNRAVANVLNSIFYDNFPDQLSLEQWNENCATLSVDYSLVQDGQDSVHFDTTSCVLNWGVGNIDFDPQFCDPDSGYFSLAEGSPCIGTGHDGANMGALGIGCDALSNDETSSIAPVSFVLHQNYPNPFNPVTTIQYELPENSFVNIRIYDLKGRLVNTLVSKGQTAGYKAIKWAGVDDKGKAVSAGIYLYEIQAGNFRETKKMVLLK